MKSSKEQISPKKESAFDVEKSSRSLGKQIDDIKEEVNVLLRADFLAMENPDNIAIATDPITGQKRAMIKENEKIIYLTSDPKKVKDFELLKERKTIRESLKQPP